MSFITKRDRVFNEYDLFDLPARNEGKLKAYASCTDARAWSHFCSDKSEHLVEIIKRNNETCRPKYVPTDAIVNTLMTVKNAEISRLKRKIEEFEQMLAAYDQLELTSDQKTEIASAQAAIKAANKELDDMCLDLDLSGYTEGIDSEAFETGKSRGDEGSIHTAYEVPKNKIIEWDFEKETTPAMETKANQTGLVEPHDASTSARDSRIDDLQDVIITKDAKLSAMQNTIAVMENDICEPYCIYAHIYTALEKIFGTLCQNTKYKEYLDLLTAGKDTRGIDVKGKILYKLKVLEKFSTALIAPCSQDYSNQSKQECLCYHAHIETTFALTSPAPRIPNLDSKRALLVADIMENNEIKEILSTDSISTKQDDNDQIDDSYGIDTYSIEAENLTRLKNLQANYEDLLNCYENVKYEKSCLESKCKKYEELERDFEGLRNRLQEYKLLWNEKEHYRKRSENLDDLKEKFLVLTEETSNIETQLKAEMEINHVKSKAVDELKCENITLEKKLNDMSISFEKEKNILTCKLKEYECKMMCQEQQIKSLSMQVDVLLEQDRIPSNYDSTKTLELTDEIESLKQQVQNLKDTLFCDDEEKHQLQVEFAKKLGLINDLKMEIEEWKNNYEKAVQNQNYLQKYTKKYQEEVQMLKEENKSLTKDLEKKSNDIDQIISNLNGKSQEITNLMKELEQKKNENRDLYFQLQNTTENFGRNLSSLESEKKNALFSLKLARTDSQKLIESYENPHCHQYPLDASNSEHDIENERCLMNIVDRDNENSILLQEIHKLRAENITNISKLQDENAINKKSLELLKTESTVLKHKLLHFDSLSQQFRNLKESHDRLISDKIKLENELRHKTSEMENILHLRRKESETLMDRLQKSKNLQDELNNNYQEMVNDKYSLLSDLSDKDAQLEILSGTLNEIKLENESLLQKSQHMNNLEQELNTLSKAYVNLKNDFDNKTKEFDNLYNNLEIKIEENRELTNQIKNLHNRDISNKNSIAALDIEKSNIETNLNTMKKQSAELYDKLKYYENMEHELSDLKCTYDQVRLENEKIQKDMEMQTNSFKKLQDQNIELNNYSQYLLAYNEELEKNLTNARNELLAHSVNPQDVINVKKEIENMKQEKNKNHEKIKRLLNKLDESEYIISSLKEDLIARDDKISLLENHINELQDEVRRLHKTLADLTESSEQIKDYSLQNIEQSLKRMEAHHSKATHNMRNELARLQSNNNMLESQLSATKIKSDESIRDVNKYASQIACLQNERIAIIMDIQQLEITSIGESALSPNNATVEDIHLSLKKIIKCLESRHSKNTSLEKTLLKVQSSFQLVLDKADEEKKNDDIAKQKLLNDKQAAIADLQKVEKELLELKQKYEEQASLDKRLISDLQAEILNQNLIIEKINKSKADYITKLEDEIQSLQKMYETSISRVRELQDMMNNMSVDNNRNLDIIEKTNKTLRDKCKEIDELHSTIHNLKHKVVQSVSTQIEKKTQVINQKFTQTHQETLDEKSINEPVTIEKIQKLEDDSNDFNINFSENSKNIMTEILPINEFYPLNEVQIMRAHVDPPSLDCAKTEYINYKVKQLNFGPLEQCSIPSFNKALNSPIEKSFTNENEVASRELVVKDNVAVVNDSNKEKCQTIDVYNLQPSYTNSSPNINKSKHGKETKKSKIITKQRSNSLNDNFSSNIENTAKKHKSDKDLFVIYNDSDYPVENNTNVLEIYSRDELQQSNHNNEMKIPTENTIRMEYGIINTSQTKDISEAIKQKLQIELPRIVTDSTSINNISDGDNKSLDSYTNVIYKLPKRATYSDTNIKNKQDSSNFLSASIALIHSPDASDKLSREENIHDLYLENQGTESSQLQSNVQSSNKINVNLLRVSSDLLSVQDSLKITQNPQLPKSDSRHNLLRVGANVLLTDYSNEKYTTDTVSSQHYNESQETLKSVNFGLQYILDTMKSENDPHNLTKFDKLKSIKRNSNIDKENHENGNEDYNSEILESYNKFPEKDITSFSNDPHKIKVKNTQKSSKECGVLVKMDCVEDYENKIRRLTAALEHIESDYKKKIYAVKVQYDSNIKNIINEHNQGVQSIQSLHEETMQDVIKLHENEVENLRTMSIEALRKVEKLEKENHALKTKIYNKRTFHDEEPEPVKIPTSENKKRRGRSQIDAKTLTKTSVEAFNVKPKIKSHGPCTCSVDMNLSDTIRNIFEQVDTEQRKLAENAYLKYIASKISKSNIEVLDAQELSFLHLKVCRTWKTKLSKEEALQKKIDSLESDLINKQRQAQLHMAELDRKVAEERRRLQEVREAVCRNSPTASRDDSPDVIRPQTATMENNTSNSNYLNIGGRRSAGDLSPGLSGVVKNKRTKTESNRAVLAKLDSEERRDRKFFEEPPIRLKRSHDRPTMRKK